MNIYILDSNHMPGNSTASMNSAQSVPSSLVGDMAQDCFRGLRYPRDRTRSETWAEGHLTLVGTAGERRALGQRRLLRGANSEADSWRMCQSFSDTKESVGSEGIMMRTWKLTVSKKWHASNLMSLQHSTVWGGRSLGMLGRESWGRSLKYLVCLGLISLHFILWTMGNNWKIIIKEVAWSQVQWEEFELFLQSNY